MLRLPSKVATHLLRSSASLSAAVLGALLPGCSEVVSVGADPTSLDFPASDFVGTGALTRTTTVCYTGPGQADCTAEVPAPFSLVGGEGSTGEGGTGEGTTVQFSISEGSCFELEVALAAPADLDESLAISVVGELISGTVGVDLHATAEEEPGDGGGTDGGGTDGGGSDGGSADGGGTDGGGTDGGGDGGGTDDTGGVASPCPGYSGLATSRVRTYQATTSYRDLYRYSGTQTVTVDASDPAAPVLVASFSMTDTSGGVLSTTQRDSYTCTSAGATLVRSETVGSLVTSDGTTIPIARTDTYSDGMLAMVHGFGTGGSVADTFTFVRDEDGRTTTINGSNVMNGTAPATTETAVGTWSTVQTHIQYAAGSDALNYYAYLDEELGVVKSFYWELVGLD
ncbi:hypothetical protein L6R53_15220 [Myxococcota bacterium]|nr:hypothetical protein [Myxococcota bacterium]